jgi:regulator of sigma E protease
MGVLGSTLLFVVAFGLLITVVVVVHESGHFFFAKLFGVRVDEFSVGFGPRLAGVRRGDTVYRLRVLPLGGFVKMPGMLGLEGEADAGERNFYRATIPKRMIIIIAGIVFNFVFGALCFAVTFAQPTQARVTSNESAAAAGLHDGDVILRLGSQTIDNSTGDSVARGLHTATQGSQGQPLPVTYQTPTGATPTATIRPELVVYAGAGAAVPASLAGRPLVITAVNGKPVGVGDPATILGGGQAVTVDGFIQHNPDSGTGGDRFSGVRLAGVTSGDGRSGGLTAAWRIGYAAAIPGDPLPRALANGFLEVPNFIAQTADVLAHLVVQPSQTAGQLSGPVGIAAAADSTIKQGWVQYLGLVGAISLSLGFVNVLPIPFLDGGRFVFVAIEAVRRRRIDPRREAVVHAVGLVLLILVFVFITISDIHRLSGAQP